MRGSKASTLKAYESVYNVLRGLCLSKGINLGRLYEEARCVVVMELEESGRAVGSLRQILVVVAMVNEAIGDKAVECSGVEKTVRRSEDN